MSEGVRVRACERPSFLTRKRPRAAGLLGGGGGFPGVVERGHRHEAERRRGRGNLREGKRQPPSAMRVSRVASLPLRERSGAGVGPAMSSAPVTLPPPGGHPFGDAASLPAAPGVFSSGHSAELSGQEGVPSRQGGRAAGPQAWAPPAGGLWLCSPVALIAVMEGSLGLEKGGLGGLRASAGRVGPRDGFRKQGAVFGFFSKHGTPSIVVFKMSFALYKFMEKGLC